MATSNRLLAYLESARNLAGCAGGALGLVLHFTGVAGPWWPGAVAGLYGLGALLAPGRGPRGGAGGGAGGGANRGAVGGAQAGSAPARAGAAGSVLSPEVEAELAAVLGGDPVLAGPGTAGVAPAAPPVPAPPAAPVAAPGAALRATLAELEAYLADADLPWSAGVGELLAELGRRARTGREAAALRAAERVAAEELPLAVDAYLRARAWERWSPAGGVDPALVLGREVARMTAALG
ncbi:hypothetical protein GCM10010495_32270 [Kitasatospora herbaricolor]|uniref:hypothetical protein n=1 Tax=Kitasatospora herbaricolor TaxID=68217 RepID=UPI00174D96E3|nr:hypothetical protein [Kitasatospora herbaricolor]MDQ0307705.1 hypothetical protein [Kitasatospora herbaricolor]GGV15767.1 hypothetical protein GCM10010495_32270 [Kitasatospora herbaricolor]